MLFNYCCNKFYNKIRKRTRLFSSFYKKLVFHSITMKDIYTNMIKLQIARRIIYSPNASEFIYIYTVCMPFRNESIFRIGLDVGEMSITGHQIL